MESIRFPSILHKQLVILLLLHTVNPYWCFTYQHKHWDPTRTTFEAFVILALNIPVTSWQQSWTSEINNIITHFPVPTHLQALKHVHWCSLPIMNCTVIEQKRYCLPRFHISRAVLRKETKYGCALHTFGDGDSDLYTAIQWHPWWNKTVSLLYTLTSVSLVFVSLFERVMVAVLVLSFPPNSFCLHIISESLFFIHQSWDLKNFYATELWPC